MKRLTDAERAAAWRAKADALDARNAAKMARKNDLRVGLYERTMRLVAASMGSVLEKDKERAKPTPPEYDVLKQALDTLRDMHTRVVSESAARAAALGKEQK